MKFIKIRCRRCGYELTIPETTTSVICGSCGEINRFSRLTSLLRKQRDLPLEAKWEDKTPAMPPSSGKSMERRNQAPLGIPDFQSPDQGREENIPLPGEDEEIPEQGSATKIMTLIFIITPFIAIAVEHFKLPSYFAIIAIAAVIFLIFLLKKRS
jgi:predicted RNA-binding Zn-ribbon protein involved in translation (DUF1610 family)